MAVPVTEQKLEELGRGQGCAERSHRKAHSCCHKTCLATWAGGWVEGCQGLLAAAAGEEGSRGAMEKDEGEEMGAGGELLAGNPAAWTG